MRHFSPGIATEFVHTRTMGCRYSHITILYANICSGSRPVTRPVTRTPRSCEEDVVLDHQAILLDELRSLTGRGGQLGGNIFAPPKQDTYVWVLQKETPETNYAILCHLESFGRLSRRSPFRLWVA